MDIDQAHKIIEVTPEELKSFEKYISYDHILINMLCNMDIDYYKEAKEKSIIPKGKEEFKALLNDFINMFSIMTKMGSSPPKILYRGSSDNHLQIIPKNSFISTSLSRNTAQSFIAYGNGAISTYFVSEDVPVNGRLLAK